MPFEEISTGECFPADLNFCVSHWESEADERRDNMHHMKTVSLTYAWQYAFEDARVVSIDLVRCQQWLSKRRVS